MMEIINDNMENWFVELKQYQSQSLRLLIQEYGEEGAAEKWLTANGPSNQIAFGGMNDPNSSNTFWKNFKDEFNKFICGDPKYDEERGKLGDSFTAPKQALISIVSGALGAFLGVTGALLAPVVCILLFNVGKIGVNAYCISVV